MHQQNAFSNNKAIQHTCTHNGLVHAYVHICVMCLCITRVCVYVLYVVYACCILVIIYACVSVHVCNVSVYVCCVFL